MIQARQRAFARTTDALKRCRVVDTSLGGIGMASDVPWVPAARRWRLASRPGRPLVTQPPTPTVHQSTVARGSIGPQVSGLAPVAPPVIAVPWIGSASAR